MGAVVNLCSSLSLFAKFNFIRNGTSTFSARCVVVNFENWGFVRVRVCCQNMIIMSITMVLVISSRQLVLVTCKVAIQT